MFSRVFPMIIAAVFLSAPSFAQESEHEQHHPDAAQETQASGSQAEMGEMCRMVQHRMEQMHQKHAEMQAELDEAVSKMNAAEGEERVDAVVNVLNELVTKQKSMHEMHGNMMQGMMKHMSAHMAKGMDASASKEMMSCPMMGEMMKGGMMQKEGSGSKRDGGSESKE